MGGSARADLPGLAFGTSAALGVPTHLKSRRSAAMYRQVRQRPVDGRDRPDRPRGQVSDDHRGQLVDLAVQGQLAPTATTTTSTSTSSLRCGWMRSPWPSRTRLPAGPLRPAATAPRDGHRPRRGWPDRPEAWGQASRHLPIPDHRLPSMNRPGSPAGFSAAIQKAFRHGPLLPKRPGRYRSTWRDRCCGGHGTASPAVPAPRPGPCPRTRTGRCRGHPAGPTPPAGRVKGAWRPCGTAGGGP